MNGIIYSATNRKNGKIYIGQTIRSLEERKKSHKRTVKAGKNFYFYGAIRKYGFDAFKWDTIYNIEAPTDTLLIEHLNIAEQMWIAKLNTLTPNGYNLTTGGNNGKPSEETKRKMSESKRGKKRPDLSLRMTGRGNPMFGRTGEKAPGFGRAGEKHPMFGKKCLDHSLRMTGEKHPMFGKTGEKNPNWKGNKAKVKSIRQRKRRAER